MIQVIKTDIDKYINLPIMIAEETGEDLEYVYQCDVSSDRVWHNYFLDKKSSIKPDNKIAVQWDSKIFQYEQLKDRVKLPKYDYYSSSLSLIKNLPYLKSKYKAFMITNEYGVNGLGYMYCDENTDPSTIFLKYGYNSQLRSKRLRVSEFIPNVTSVSLHLIIANSNEFYISPMVKQHIEGQLYRGGSYPYDMQIDCAPIINTLFESGYVGLAHVDFMVADDIYFGEINPRIAGSTPYMSYCLEREYGINLPYLEYYVVQNGTLPSINDKRRCNITWDFQIKKGRRPTGEWISHLDARRAFDKSGTYYLPLLDEYIKLELTNDQGNNL